MNSQTQKRRIAPEFREVRAKTTANLSKGKISSSYLARDFLYVQHFYHSSHTQRKLASIPCNLRGVAFFLQLTNPIFQT